MKLMTLLTILYPNNGVYISGIQRKYVTIYSSTSTNIDQCVDVLPLDVKVMLSLLDLSI